MLLRQRKNPVLIQVDGQMGRGGCVMSGKPHSHTVFPHTPEEYTLASLLHAIKTHMLMVYVFQMHILALVHNSESVCIHLHESATAQKPIYFD